MMPPVWPEIKGNSRGKRPNFVAPMTAKVPPPPDSQGTQMNFELPRIPVVS